MWKCWSGPMSPASRNVKAEAMAAAHKQRVEAEVNAYLLSESRKTEARIATAEVKKPPPFLWCVRHVRFHTEWIIDGLWFTGRELFARLLIRLFGFGLQSMIEQKRMKDEARAIENRKREEAKAEQSIRNAEVDKSSS